MKSILGSSDKRTLVEKARAQVARSNRKHKEALVEFTNALVDQLPSVIMRASDMGHCEYTWNLLETETYKEKCATSAYFLRDHDSLTVDDFAFVHDTIVARARNEPGLSWKVFYPSDPHLIILYWA